jgi:hypothetical protein
MFSYVVKSLKRKHAKALPAMQQSLDVFTELDQSVDPNLRKVWEEQECRAMEFRGNFLDIYSVNKEKCEVLCFSNIIKLDYSCCISVPATYTLPSAPRLNASTDGDQKTHLWLETGIVLEVEQ